MKREPAYYQYLFYFMLYFFFNNFLLKEGLLYTTLLVPVLLYWLYKRQRLAKMFAWGVLLLIPIPIQLIIGIDLKTYIISTIMVVSAWIFLFSANETVRIVKDDLDDLFLKVLMVNAVLFLVAMLILPFSTLRDFMWDTVPMSRNLSSIPRLKMLAYEPSHYGLLLAPVFIYFILKIITGKTKHPLILGAGIFIPLILTFSFGIIGILLLAIFLGSFIYIRSLGPAARKILLYSFMSLVLVVCGLWLLWPSNPVYTRIDNIFTGADSSSKGRLVHAFMFARDLVFQHHAWFGVGPGQVKILAHDMIVNFYKYTGNYSEIVRIPNSMGEMLATYGIYGFVLKIFFEIFFFIRMKVFSNLYSFILFLFIFIYQFTGSFLVNAAELGIWAIAFHSRFEGFDIKRLNPLKL